MTVDLNKLMLIWEEGRIQLRKAGVSNDMYDVVLEWLVAPYVQSMWLSSRGFPAGRESNVDSRLIKWVTSNTRRWMRLWHVVERGPLILIIENKDDVCDMHPSLPGYKVKSLKSE